MNLLLISGNATGWSFEDVAPTLLDLPTDEQGFVRPDGIMTTSEPRTRLSSVVDVADHLLGEDTSVRVEQVKWDIDGNGAVYRCMERLVVRTDLYGVLNVRGDIPDPVGDKLEIQSERHHFKLAHHLFIKEPRKVEHYSLEDAKALFGDDKVIDARSRFDEAFIAPEDKPNGTGQ